MIIPSLVFAFGLGTTSAEAQTTTDRDPRVSEFARQIEAGETEKGLAGLYSLSAQGVRDADNMLGEALSGAYAGVIIDRPKACLHFRTAKELGGSAAHNYAACLWEGAFGQGRELEQARVWYQRGIDDGFTQSYCALVNMVIEGLGGSKDTDAGLALCRAAAEMGDAHAQTDLADYYHAGAVVPQDLETAKHWYRLTAEKGQRNALFWLGMITAREGDLTTAHSLFSRSYEAGRKDADLWAATTALGLAVPNAPNGPVDAELLARAKTWYTLTLENNHNGEANARAAVALAQISGYEALLRQQSGNNQ